MYDHVIPQAIINQSDAFNLPDYKPIKNVRVVVEVKSKSLIIVTYKTSLHYYSLSQKKTKDTI